jgi:hypothetical protein
MNEKNWRKILALWLMLAMFLLPVAGVMASENDVENREKGNVVDEDAQNGTGEENEQEVNDTEKGNVAGGDEEIDDEDEDGVNDEQEEYEEREVEIEHTANETEIRSGWEGGDLEDEFRVRFRTDEKLEIELEYSTEINATETELEFEVTVEKIVEYVDTNGNGRYDENDTVISTYTLGNAEYEVINYTIETTLDNETVHIISTSTIDGVFGIVLYVVGSFANLESGTLTPTAVKIDFVINNYNYSANNSQLALQVEVKTEYETEIETETYDETQGYAENETELSIAAGNYTGFFSWLGYAIVDGITRPVNTTVKSKVELTAENGEQEFKQKDNIYFCYPRGDSIVHDPKVGVVSVSSLTFGKPQIPITPSDNIQGLKIQNS